MLDRLPKEILFLIFLKLDIPIMLRLAQVSKKFKNLVADDIIWKEICKSLDVDSFINSSVTSYKECYKRNVTQHTQKYFVVGSEESANLQYHNTNMSNMTLLTFFDVFPNPKTPKIKVFKQKNHAEYYANSLKYKRHLIHAPAIYAVQLQSNIIIREIKKSVTDHKNNTHNLLYFTVKKEQIKKVICSQLEDGTVIFQENKSCKIL